MFPGLISKLSESSVVAAPTLAPKTDILRVSGTTAIDTILPPYTGSSGILFIIPLAAFTMTNTGNIFRAVTITSGGVGRVLVMIYDKATNKWYPSYGSGS